MNYYIVLTSFIPRQVVYKLASLKDRNSEPYLFKTISVLQIQKKKKTIEKKSNIVILTSLCHVDDIAAPLSYNETNAARLWTYEDCLGIIIPH